MLCRLSLGDRAQSPCLPLLPLCVQDDRHRLHRCGNTSDAGIAAGRRAAPNTGQPTKPNKLRGHQGGLYAVSVCMTEVSIYRDSAVHTQKKKNGHWELPPFVTGFVANCRDWYLINQYIDVRNNDQSSGAVWESWWPSWAPHPNKPYGFCGHKAILNHAHAPVSSCP